MVRPLTVCATKMGLLARLLVRGRGFASSPSQGSMAHARCEGGRLWTGRLRLDLRDMGVLSLVEAAGGWGAWAT